MLQSIAQNIWHVQHGFQAAGLSVSSRMTVVRLHDDSLWLHSPVPLSAEVLAQLNALGEVKYLIAPNKMHHLFMAPCIAHFPNAKVLGARGLRKKRPDLTTLTELGASIAADWEQDFVQIFFGGLPIGNETVWFHKSSRTLIVTDLCQCWEGPLTFASGAYARLTGVRNKLAVPRSIRLMIKDKSAARQSAEAILALPIERVVTAHNSIVEKDAHDLMRKAFAFLVE